MKSTLFVGFVLMAFLQMSFCDDEKPCPDGCDFPKTAEECAKCQDAIGGKSSKIENGECQIEMENSSCYEKLDEGVSSCDGILGVKQKEVNSNCYISFHKP